MISEHSCTAAQFIRQPAPRVSVILTTYNHQDFIGQAIEGVLAQNGEVSFELIILDDVSTDATGEIIETFVARHPGLIRVLRPARNLNSCAETRRAVEQAAGEFIAFLDGDDYWTDPDKLRKQVAFLDENRSFSMCCHDCIIVNEFGALVSDTYLPGQTIPTVGAFRHIARHNYVASLSPVIRRSALMPLPRWADHYEWGDWALYLFAVEHGWIGYIPDKMGAYRRHSGGQCTGMPMEQRFHITLGFLDDFASHLPAERTRELDLGKGSAAASLIVNQLRTGNLAAAARSLTIAFGMARGRRRFAVLANTVWELVERCMRLLRCRMLPSLTPDY